MSNRPVTPDRDPILSVVVPAYNEEESLPILYERLLPVLSGLAVPWELIIADDGSSDDTWAKIMALHDRDPRVRGARLSRNFGHQYGLFAGLVFARGDAVVSMDADLQHPPEVIPELLEEWRRGRKIVHTARAEDESAGWFKRRTSALFYRLFSALSGVHITPGAADFRLMDRQVVDILLRLPEDGLFLRGLVHWMGFPSSSVEYEASARLRGRSKYDLRRMLLLGWTGITSFSVIPLRVAVVIGVLTSVVAFLGIVYALYSKLIVGTAVAGWASAVSIISFLFGVLFILLGIVGEYVGRIFVEVRSRPRFIVQDLVGIEGESRTVVNSVTELAGLSQPMT